ncbi:MAG: hypothetical protein KAW12_15175 [Candidatus Aminicenantes bacterium]|nr:hypothetical protein [Candidatus Aminicenantes bacterium]
MKKIKTKVLLLFFIFSTAFCLYSGGFSFQVDFVSRYIWRGFDLNPVHKPALQPQLTYAVGDSGFAVNLWCNFSFEDKNTDEVDFAFTYDFKTGENFALTVGLTSYNWVFIDGFKFKDDTTREFFVSAGLPKALLSPTFTFYYDINLGDGLYAELALGHSLPVNEKVAIELSGKLGYNAGQWLPDGADTGLSDLNFGAAVPFKIGKVTVTPYVNYTLVLLDFIKTLGENNHFWFGISIAR